MMSIKIEEVAVEVVTAELDKVNVASGIADESAIVLRGQFGTFYNDIVSWRKQAEAITDPENPEQQAIARTVRLGLRRVRCDVETVRKTLKAESLSRGKAIDGYANVLKHLTEPIEAQLLDVEKHAERQEEARVAVMVTERTTLIVDAEADPTAYNLAAMDEETFAIVLAGAVKRRDDRVETERVAEAARIKKEADDKKEQDRVRVENEKLKADAVKVEAAAKVEREAAAKVQADIEAKAASKAAAVEAKAKTDRDAAAAKLKAAADTLKAEQAKSKKIEDDAAAAKAKVEADKAKVAADAAAAEQAAADAAAAAARAPDRDKISAMAVKMRAAVMPEMATDEGKAAMEKIASQREKFAAWIDGIAKGL